MYQAPDGKRFTNKKEFHEYLLLQGYLELQDQAGNVLVKYPGDIVGASFGMRNLQRCTVVVLDCVGQLIIEQLHGCQVFVGVIDGSCFIRSCKGSSFSIITKQFRAWQCDDCEFFLNTTSDPVIEECSNVSFGKLDVDLKFPTLEKVLRESNWPLVDNGSWKNVFDFSSQDSSIVNWSLIEPTKALVDVRTKKMSSFAIHLLRHVFWKYDADKDGKLSFEEVNAYQKGTGSDEVVSSAEIFREFCDDAEIPTDDEGRLGFDGFLQLYSLQGEDGLKQDLLKLGMPLRQVVKFELSEYFGSNSMNDEIVGETEEISFEDDLEINSLGLKLAIPQEPVGSASDLDFSDEDNEEDHDHEAVPNIKPSFVEDDDDDFDGFEDQEIEVPTTREETSAWNQSDASEAESELDLESDASSSSSSTDDMFDVETTARHLCIEAQTRGIDILKWFGNFDDALGGSLEKKWFERAFSGMLISMCTLAPEEYSDLVEQIMHPDRLSALCEIFEDPHNGRINYMPLAIGAQTADAMAFIRKYEKLPSAKSKDAPVQPTPLRRLPQALEGDVESFLGNLMRSNNASDIYERLRMAIHSYKWSISGVTSSSPIKFHDVSDFISTANLRHALESSLHIEIKRSQVGAFVEVVRRQSETAEEKRSRTLQSTPNGCTTITCIASLLRWLNSKRVSRPISRDNWLDNKKKSEKRQRAYDSDMFDKAREGQLEAIDIFWNDHGLLISVLQENTLIPKELIPREASRRTNEFLSSMAGQSDIRKRALRLSCGSRATSNHASTAAAEQQLRGELFEEFSTKLANDVGFCKEIFLEYARGRKNGRVMSSLVDWLKSKDQQKKNIHSSPSKSHSPSKLRTPGRQITTDPSGVGYCILASDGIARLKDITQMASVEQNNASFAVCRTTRNVNLDRDVASLFKEQLQKVLTDSSSKKRPDHVTLQRLVNSGTFVMSHEEFVRHFQSVLLSLSNESHGNVDAQKILNPRIFAEKMLKEYLETQDGQDDIASGAENLSKAGLCTTSCDADLVYRERKISMFIGEILEHQGFVKDESPLSREAMVKRAEKEKRKRVRSQMNRWSRDKARERKKVEKSKKAEELVRMQECENRKLQARTQYKKWVRAEKKNQYYSKKADDDTLHIGTTKTVHIALRPRQDKQPAMLKQPAWVFETILSDDENED